MMIVVVVVIVVMIVMMILPHVVVLGRALVPIVLLVVGFQLLIHVKGHDAKA